MVSIKQLQKQIQAEKKKVRKEQVKQNKLIEKSRLKTELFKLKKRKQIEAAGKAGKLLRKGGLSLIKAGKKAAPVLQKQARLIRDQQLRDEALAKKLRKIKKKGKSNRFGVI